MKKYAYLDSNGIYHIDKDYDIDKQKSTDEFLMALETINDPYNNIGLFKKVIKLINPEYTDLSQEVLNRNEYLNYIISHPYIINGLKEIYTIDNLDDCSLLLSLYDIKENYFFIETKEKLDMLRDYIIGSTRFSESINKNIEENYNSSARIFIAYKCPELIIGYTFKSIKGELQYAINKL